ncbi:hypothetical protein [Actinomadura oligospora]|uniref:hypothetical protein n=1 Tax=Actinomadura oligospora TaxID=111804 RepID=UPI0004AE5E9F|nr:hypothetical protein [Actinomadura oligospora]
MTPDPAPALLGLAANPSLPPDLLDRLIALGSRVLACELAERDDLTPTQALALIALDESCAWSLAGTLDPDDLDPAAFPEAALALLNQGHGRPEWSRFLAADPDPTRRARLTDSPDLPADVQHTLSRDEDPDVVEELARVALPELAATLARHPHAAVRAGVAANPATPPSLLASLLTGDGLPPAVRCEVCEREEIPFVHDPSCPRIDCHLPPDAACDGSHQSTVRLTRLRALENPSTPASAAMPFADDPSYLLRCTLATRADLTREAAERLATSSEPGVLGELAANPAISTSLMRTFATSTDPSIRRDLANNPRVPLDVLAALAPTTKLGTTLLPRVAAASPAETETMAASPNPAVRMLVANRRDLPAPIRDALADDPDAKVVKAIAPHPGLSGARLRAMVDAHGARVAAHVASNPDAPSGVLEALATLNPARKALTKIAQHPNATAPALLACLGDAKAGRFAASHPALPPEVILELLTDHEKAEAAAANPSLPPDVMRRIADRTRGDSGRYWAQQ